MMEKIALPGIDTQKLLDSRRKDIEALLQANEHAFAALEALTRKQADLLVDVMREWQAGARDVFAASKGADRINQTAAHAQKAFTHALTSMKDMAEIATKSSQEVVAILNKRYREGLDELRSILRPKAA